MSAKRRGGIEVWRTGGGGLTDWSWWWVWCGLLLLTAMFAHVVYTTRLLSRKRGVEVGPADERGERQDSSVRFYRAHVRRSLVDPKLLWVEEHPSTRLVDDVIADRVNVIVFSNHVAAVVTGFQDTLVSDMDADRSSRRNARLEEERRSASEKILRTRPMEDVSVYPVAFSMLTSSSSVPDLPYKTDVLAYRVPT